MTAIGAYVGQVAPNNQAELDHIGQQIGHPVDYAVAFLDQGSWGGFDSSAAYDSSQWAPGQKLLYSMPLTVSGTSLADVANGSHNGDFHAAAEAIAAHDPNATIRLGWEANGGWMPWAAQNDPQGYIHAFQDVVNVLHSVSSGFKIDWTVNNGTGSIDPEQFYPGDQFVDTIGMDMNIHSYGRSSEQAWQDTVHQSNGLQWQADFAAAHGKPLSFPEWATDLNDGVVINHMADWINSHNVAFQSYWDSNDNIHSAFNENPNDANAYVHAFGNGANDYWHVG